LPAEFLRRVNGGAVSAKLQIIFKVFQDVQKQIELRAERKELHHQVIA
jgi:hypothetical protein